MSPQRHQGRSPAPPRARTRAVADSRRCQGKALRCCRYGLYEIRSRRELRPLESPAPRANHPPFLEPLALQDVEPLVGARVDEQLEMRIQRELILAGVDGELHSAER